MVNHFSFIRHQQFRSILGALLGASAGLALLWMPLGESWINASYDYLFRFGSRAVTNQMVVVFMDNEAHDYHKQPRDRPWDRKLHAQLLNRLADDGCPLVVLDTFFRGPRDPEADAELADALRRLPAVVLMAEQTGAEHPDLVSARPVFPADLFLHAARTNWGVAWSAADLDGIVRRHWPFPAPGPYPSLPWTAARLAGAALPIDPQAQWLRYYGADGAWIGLSYPFALAQAPDYFRDKIVFIGNKPKTSVPDSEIDEFRTPYSRWTGESAGGVEILATTFLNLLNRDWLRRPPGWLEGLILVGTGLLLGWLSSRLHPVSASMVAVGLALVTVLGGVSLSYSTNLWFPWLIIAGGQIPVGLAWAWASRKLAPTRLRVPPVVEPPMSTIPSPTPPRPMPVSSDLPDTPDYELFDPPFGEGAFGRVWLARNAIGQWQALKAVYRNRFPQNTEPYDWEFRGIQRFKPVSDRHPGLLRVDFVSTKKPEGYFYYVMELGDAVAPGWENHPADYKPRDLAWLRDSAPGHRLPVSECVRLVLDLTEALSFLHDNGLTHRDIKPSNIIFVDGHPKLADVGLVTKARRAEEVTSSPGTPGYMPPPPEHPGTVQADIYALGMVLYVISTGQSPALFPELATTVISGPDPAEFMRLNSIILQACQPDARQRYATVAELRVALLEIQQFMEV